MAVKSISRGPILVADRLFVTDPTEFVVKYFGLPNSEEVIILAQSSNSLFRGLANIIKCVSPQIGFF